MPFGPKKVDLHGSTRVVTQLTICDCSDTEKEGRRELTQHGVLSCLGVGDGWRGDDWYCDRRAVSPAFAMTYCTRLPCQGAAQLKASGNHCCCSCWYKSTKHLHDRNYTRKAESGNSCTVQYGILVVHVIYQQQLEWPESRS